MAKAASTVRNILDTSILSANAVTAHKTIEKWKDERYVPILELLISMLNDLIYPPVTEVQENHPNSDEASNSFNNGTKSVINLGVHSGRASGLFADFSSDASPSSNGISERQQVINEIVKVLKQAQYRVIKSNSFSEDKSCQYSTLQWVMMDTEIGIDFWELQCLTEVWFVLLSKRHVLSSNQEIWVLSNKKQEQLKEALKMMAQQRQVAPITDSSQASSASQTTSDKNDNNHKNDKNDKNDKNENVSNNNTNKYPEDTSNEAHQMYSKLADFVLGLSDEFTAFDRLNSFVFGNIDISACHLLNMVLADYVQEKVIDRLDPAAKMTKLNVIDMGCGWGNVARALKNEEIAYKEGVLNPDIKGRVQINLHGLDSNSKMLRVGKGYNYNKYYTEYPKVKNGEKYSFQLCNVQTQRIPFKDHTIDGVVSCNFLLANNFGVLTKNKSGFGEFVELPSEHLKRELYRVLRNPFFNKNGKKNKKDKIPAFVLVLCQCLHPNLRVLDVDLRNLFNLNKNENENENENSEDVKSKDEQDLQATDFGMKLVKYGRLKEFVYGIWEHRQLAEIEKEKDAVSAMMKHEEYTVLREQLAQLGMTVDDEGNIMSLQESQMIAEAQNASVNATNAANASNVTNPSNAKDDTQDVDPDATMSTV